MSSKHSHIRPQANWAGYVEKGVKEDYKRTKLGLLSAVFGPGLSILFMAALTSISSISIQAATVEVQLFFEIPVTLADGKTPTSTGFAVQVGTFTDLTAAQVAQLVSSPNVGTNRDAILNAFSLFAATSILNDNSIFEEWLDVDLGNVSTPTTKSPFYALVANNADFGLATELGIFLHTINKFPENTTGNQKQFVSFNLTSATAIFGSQNPKTPNYELAGIQFNDDIFILGDLSKSIGIISSSEEDFKVGIEKDFPIQTNFGANHFQILERSGSQKDKFTIDQVTGILNGEVEESGTVNLKIRATNLQSLVQSDQDLTLNLIAGFAIDSELTVEGIRGVAFSYEIKANEIADSFDAIIPANASWLTRNGAVLSGTPPIDQNDIDVIISATKDGIRKPETLRITFRNLTLTGSGVTTKRLGEDVSYTITPEAAVTGVFTATGLPYGLSIDPTTGTISGRAVAADQTADTSDCGPKTINVKLSDSIGNELTTFSFVITLETKLPEISSLGPVMGGVGNTLTYPITVSSPEATAAGDKLSIVPTDDANYRLLDEIGLKFDKGSLSGVLKAAKQPFKIKIKANNAPTGALGGGIGNEVELLIDIDYYAPAHASKNRRKFYTSVGVPFTYTYDTANSPTALIVSGSLPPGVSSSQVQGGTSTQVTFQGSCTKVGEYALTFSPSNVNRDGITQTAVGGPMSLTIVVLPASTRPAVGSGASGTFRYRAGQPIAHYISGNPAPSGLFFNVSGLPAGLALERAKSADNKNVASGTFQPGDDTLTNDGNSSGSAGGGQFDAGLIWGTVDASKRGTYPLTVYAATRAGTTKTTLTLVIE
jgi:hypothetical protein